jgi:hypothetical protein
VRNKTYSYNERIVHRLERITEVQYILNQCYPWRYIPGFFLIQLIKLGLMDDPQIEGL